MIVADILGPWWDVEATAVDEETGETYTYRDRRRLPRFLHDFGDMSWQDVTGQAAENIPPDPALCVWRVWASPEQIDAMEASDSYVVLTRGEVGRAFERA